MSDPNAGEALFLDQLHEELTLDYVGLWSVVLLARHALGRIGDRELRQIVLKGVGQLLDLDEIELGFPLRDGRFLAWTYAPKDALAKIEREWEALGRDPNIGEIVWLNKLDAAPLQSP